MSGLALTLVAAAPVLYALCVLWEGRPEPIRSDVGGLVRRLVRRSLGEGGSSKGLSA